MQLICTCSSFLHILLLNTAALYYNGLQQKGSASLMDPFTVWGLCYGRTYTAVYSGKPEVCFSDTAHGIHFNSFEWRKDLGSFYTFTPVF